MDIFSSTLRLLPSDNKSHIQVKFSVPDGLKCLTVSTVYSPKYEYDEEKCIKKIDEGLSRQQLARPLGYQEKRRCVPLANHIAWSLDDSEKRLGTEHRHRPDQTHIISEIYSSNGFIRTQIKGGEWTLTVSVNSIVTDHIDVEISVKGYGDYPTAPEPRDYGSLAISNDSEIGKLTWQRVEMHCHTVASDGDMQPEELVQNAIKRGYKAICLTDHNTVSNVEEVKRCAEKYGLIAAGGIEWTTFWGHLTVIGGKSDVIWTDIAPDNIDKCIARARELGDVVTLAHPKRIGSPLCAGCHNLLDIKRWENLSGYEVWSHYDPSVSPANLLAKSEWISLLDRGYRLSALYGYDWHAPDEGGPCYAYTYLGIDGVLSQDSIVDAVKRGRTYVTMGYCVEVSLERDGQIYTVGEDICSGIYKVRIMCDKTADYPFDSVLESIVITGNVCEETVCRYDGKETVFDVEVNAADDGYLRIEGRGKVQGKLSDIFITSPIYVKEEKL